MQLQLQTKHQPIECMHQEYGETVRDPSNKQVHQEYGETIAQETYAISRQSMF